MANFRANSAKNSWEIHGCGATTNHDIAFHGNGCVNFLCSDNKSDRFLVPSIRINGDGDEIHTRTPRTRHSVRNSLGRMIYVTHRLSGRFIFQLFIGSVDIEYRSDSDPCGSGRRHREIKCQETQYNRNINRNRTIVHSGKGNGTHLLHFCRLIRKAHKRFFRVSGT